ncbi:hypothetical protein M0805_005509 [Coniferiporia weirii]|nr:hypothetical protein M0805_005509 [Coniferiporia weirii]
MSLYTPLFPPTNPPPSRMASSSSLSSVETAKRPPILSYSSRLSQWHLAIAALPDELCPPSAPSSPTSKARSEKLQAEINQAVQNGLNASDFCKLRSTGLGYATTKPITNVPETTNEQEQDVPWILADTEEEWFEWERMMSERRAKSTGKVREAFAPPDVKSRNAREKVMNWKARLQPSSSHASVHTVSNGSPLGFPVIKRTSMLKESKPKASCFVTPREVMPQISAIGKESTLPDVIKEQPAVIQQESNKEGTGTANDGYIDRTCPKVRHVLPTTLSVSEKNGGWSAAQPDLVGLSEFSTFPPPSFPSDLPTSTPKNILRPSEVSDALPPPSFPSDLPTSTPKETNGIKLVSTEESKKEEQVQLVVSESRPPEFQIAKQQPVHSTPLSPPNFSSNSPVLQRVTQQRAESTTAEHVQDPPTSLSAQTRPLTPPPEDGGPASSSLQNSPHTPERQGLKRYRDASPDNAGYGHNAGPTTPQYSINGVGAIHDSAFPRTPIFQIPAVDLLATSQRSKPRPRPPSRKQFAQHMELEGGAAGESSGDGLGEPSPAKSDRSYFSSPASGDSSGSSRGSTHHIPDSPTSPLGFTQNSGLFAPIGESTQVSPKAKAQARLTSMRPLGSQTASLRAGSQRGLSRASSGLLGMAYNSQFDVDAQVNQLSNFLEQDVDLSAWGRDTDDDDDDEVAVEKLTFSTTPITF